MSNKKILFVLPIDGLGGAEQVLKMIATYYSGNEIHVFFLCKKTYVGEWDPKICKLHHANFNNRILAILKLILFLLRKRVCWDYVFSSHINVTGILGILIRLGILKKEKFVARESTTIFQRFSGIKLFQYKLMYKLGYKSIDLLICQTEDMRSKLISSMPSLVKLTKIVTIANPVSFSNIAYLNENIPEGNLIVSAGRFIYAKAYDVLIDAFYELNKSQKKYTLVLLGEGELKDEMEQKCISLGIEDQVVMPGRVSNVLSYFKKADLCVVSSRVEGFPNVLLQMMSQNTNVVSTLCAGGISDIEGLLKVNINDSETLTKAMIECLESDNSNNRYLFDKELKERDITNFMKKLKGYLYN